MPLREDILQPISPDQPAGGNIRYAPVYDRIKEARRQDDDAPQGDWEHERKVADYVLVAKLASEAIATQSKDLQLAAWLTEALLHTDGYAGLNEGLAVIRGIVADFWDGCWPEAEEGDEEMRAAPIDWVGTYLAIPSKQVPLIKGGHAFLKYLDAKTVGTEPTFEDSDTKKEAYQAAIAEGRMPLDEFMKLVSGTPPERLSSAVASIDSCFAAMEESQPLFEERFGEFVPSYSRLRESLEEVRRIVKQWIGGSAAPAPVAEPEPAAEAEVTPEVVEESVWSESPAAAPASSVPKPVSRRVTSAEPGDRDDAAFRVAAAAAFWRRDDPYSPAPYLMLRGLRWGELRASLPPDSNLFEAPSTEVRTTLRRLTNEGSHGELIEVAEGAMALPCGRAWLDLQRYVVTACEGLGYSAIADAIRAELKALLRDIPDLRDGTLLDDTPTANRETLAWLDTFATTDEPAAPAADTSWYTSTATEPEERSDATESGPDAFQLAKDAMAEGRTEEAIAILSDETAREISGRARFQRRLQLAQLCMGSGHESIAQPLLEDLLASVDRHRLEEWEAAELVANAISLLYVCLGTTGGDPAARMQLYSRICRLSPVQALKHAGQALAQGR